MYKVGILGHFGKSGEFFDGQTVKTKTLSNELKIALGSNLVESIDTYGWRKNPIGLLIKCFYLLKNCENVILLPAHNGVKVFVPLFLILNRIFRRKLHYVVIGGWLPNLLEKNNKLKIFLHEFNGIYVETFNMVNTLEKLGLDNVIHLPNFKRLNMIKTNELVYSKGYPFKLCTFSRVMKEKGIEDAIEVVKNINNNYGRIIYTLDIYGQIEKQYSERFQELEKEFPEFISYKGIVDYNDSVQVLKDYFALLFPTQFKTEGIPGTIIDAYAAGLPVVASRWDYANEIIDEGATGYIYDFLQKSQLEDLLLQIYEDPMKINNIKGKCLVKVENYSPENVIGQFIRYL
jgi:glycosyltransferase involved in cell wall biosynthesis